MIIELISKKFMQQLNPHVYFLFMTMLTTKCTRLVQRKGVLKIATVVSFLDPGVPCQSTMRQRNTNNGVGAMSHVLRKTTQS